jgi:hypothetical protein
MTASQSTFDAAYTAGTTLETDNATPSITEAVAIASLRMSNHLPFGGRARPLMSVFQNRPVAAKCLEPEEAHDNHQFWLRDIRASTGSQNSLLALHGLQYHTHGLKDEGMYHYMASPHVAPAGESSSAVASAVTV